MPFMHLVWKGNSGLGQGANYWSFWVHNEPDGTPADAPGVINVINNILDTNMMPFLNSNYSVGRVDWTYYPEAHVFPYPTQVYTFTALQGEGISPPLTARQTMLVEFKAFSNIGPTRKRVYLGRYGEENNNTSGLPEGDLISALQSWANDMLGEFSTLGHTWRPAVCRLNADSGVIESYNLLTSQLVQTKWAFLRSRDAGRGI